MKNTVCRECRKFGVKLFLKGSRCLSPKCSVTLRTYPPGMQGAKKRSVRKSEYGQQLAAKQHVKSEYQIRERQFQRYFKRASRSKEATCEKLLQELETRLDNVVYRLGWASSRPQARQLVLHGKIKVNGKKVNISSYSVAKNDTIEPTDRNQIYLINIKPPTWLNFDKKTMEAKVLRLPVRNEIESPVDEQLVVEFYSR